MSILRTRAERRRAVVFAAITTAAIAVVGYAAARNGAPRPETARAETAVAPYLPSISDLMIATIQPRHERLQRAARDGNWEFAAYELGNLRGAFRRLGEAHPTTHDMSLPDMISSATAEPFAALERAVQARDDAAFVKGYAALTDACNACHQALGHGVVAIRVPDPQSGSDLAGKAPAHD